MHNLMFDDVLIYHTMHALLLWSRNRKNRYTIVEDVIDRFASVSSRSLNQVM